MLAPKSIIFLCNCDASNSQIPNCTRDSKDIFEPQRESLLNDHTIVSLDFISIFLNVLSLLSNQIFQIFCTHKHFCIALEKGILISNFLKISMNLANCFSLSYLVGTRGYERIFSTFSFFLS